MKVLISGGGGFLGGAIGQRLLARGDSVRVLCRGDHPEVTGWGAELVRGDLVVSVGASQLSNHALDVASQANQEGTGI